MSLSADKYSDVAGVDEAGRGPLAGPVVAAAVVLNGAVIAGLGDSKKKSAAQRDRLYDSIRDSDADFGVGLAGADEIDELNIHHATLLAMARAVAALPAAPRAVLVDGKFCPAVACPAQAIVGGDDLEPCISAASIIAKVTRDRLMIALDARYPGYGFERHKGYPTAAHLDALARLGITPAHRRTFAPVRRLCGAAQ